MTQSVTAQQRGRSIAPWWVALIVLGVGLLLGAVWFLLGGLPFSNHAAFGEPVFELH